MGVTKAPPTEPERLEERPRRSLGSLVKATEFDTRMLGMLAALAVIWVLFHILSGGTFLTPRNLWNLSVQTTSVAIMASGMVLVIVSRNIDLSVGSMLGLIGMTMALVQVEILPDFIGLDHPLTWIVALAVGITLGALIGGFQGFIVAYIGVPSFIVTLGGLLVWRGVSFWAGARGGRSGSWAAGSWASSPAPASPPCWCTAGASGNGSSSGSAPSGPTSPSGSSAAPSSWAPSGC